MSVLLRVQVEDDEQVDDLRVWMDGHPEVSVRPVPRESGPNAQGSVWDFLEVACASGGAVTAAVRALQLWIESRVTTVEIAVGDSKVIVRTADARVVLPAVEAAAKALQVGGLPAAGDE